jgi:hypothetical protein
MFNMKSFVLPAAAALCLLTPSVSMIAQTAPAAQTQTGKKVKQIKFTLQNKSNSTMNLKSGDEAVTLAAGESKAMKATPGTKIVNADSSSTMAEVTDEMNGSTINLR